MLINTNKVLAVSSNCFYGTFEQCELSISAFLIKSSPKLCKVQCFLLTALVAESKSRLVASHFANKTVWGLYE